MVISAFAPCLSPRPFFEPQVSSNSHHNAKSNNPTHKTTVLTTPQPRRRPFQSTVMTSATPPSTLYPDALSTHQIAEWHAVTDRLQALDHTIAEVQSHKLVARAFGWGSQKFWRGRVKKRVPDLELVDHSLSFVSDVVLNKNHLVVAIVNKFPEVLALSTTRMQENVDLIQRNYPSLKDSLLCNAVVDNPAVLGYDFDCEGDCQSECARCWVQF